MSNSSISQNLRQLLNAYNQLSLSELARQTNIPQPTLHHLSNGITKRPRKKVLEGLAHYFNISVAQLIGQIPLDNPVLKDVGKNFTISTVPIISLDMLKEWPNNYSETEQCDQVLLTKDLGKHSFALIIKDKAVNSLFPNESVLIFTNKKPEEREFVIVYSLKYNKIFFNRLFIDKAQYFIKEEQPNGDIKLIKLNLDSDRILGSLIEARLSQF